MTRRGHAPDGAPCWVDLLTSDVGGAATFYGALFGWVALDPAPEYGGYVNFARDGVLVAGCVPRPDDDTMPEVWTPTWPRPTPGPRWPT